MEMPSALLSPNTTPNERSPFLLAIKAAMTELSMMAVEANTVDAIMLFLSVCTARTPFLDTSCDMPTTQKPNNYYRIQQPMSHDAKSEKPTKVFIFFFYLLIFQSTIRKKKWEKRLGLPPSWHWPRSGGWRHWCRWQFCWGGWGWKRGARCGKPPWGGGRLEPRYNQGFVSPYSTELLQSPSATQVIMRMERERVNGEGEKRKGGLLKRVKASGNYSRRQ